MGLLDRFKKKKVAEQPVVEENITQDPHSDFMNILRVLENSPTQQKLNQIVHEEAIIMTKRMKAKYLKQNRYMFILDKLMQHVANGKKIKGPKDFILAQYNYDNTKFFGKTSIFLPYIDELKTNNIYIENEIPEDIREFYEMVHKDESKNIKSRILAFEMIHHIMGVDFSDMTIFPNMSDYEREACIKRHRDKKFFDSYDGSVSNKKELPKDAPDNAFIEKSAYEELFDK